MSWLSEFHHALGTIKNGKVHPVYFLYGNDFYLCDTAIRAIRKILTEKHTSCDYNYVTASDTDASQLQNLLFGTSLFQSVSCLVLNNVKGLLPSARKVLNAYLDNPPADNVLILTADEIDYKNALYKRLKEKTVTLM
ncbi:MAG: hypothetical protein K0B52_00230, partial [FCB group bacterium]|nr:hypothetical protein [FCB group bacterium]